MKWTTLFIWLALLNACSSGDSSSAPPAAEPTAQDTLDYNSPVALGEFTSEKTLDATDTSYYAQGCQAPGAHGHLKQFDSRLALGQKFSTRFWSKEGEIPFQSYTVQETVKDLFPNFFETHLEISESANITGIPKGPIQIKIATISSGESPTVNSTKTDFYRPRFQGGCEGGGTSGPTEVMRLESGKYKLLSGQVVSAYRMTREGNNWAECSTSTYVNAFIRQVRIVSNEVPSTETRFCGGIQVLTQDEIQKVDGTVLYSTGEELTGY